MKFNCRTIRPIMLVFEAIDASSPEEAAHDYHCSINDGDWSNIVINLNESGSEKVLFSSIEVENNGVWISRIFKKCLVRTGGVKKIAKKTIEQQLLEAAIILNWKEDPQGLLKPGWFLEENVWK